MMKIQNIVGIMPYYLIKKNEEIYKFLEDNQKII